MEYLRNIHDYFHISFSVLPSRYFCNSESFKNIISDPDSFTFLKAASN